MDLFFNIQLIKGMSKTSNYAQTSCPCGSCPHGPVEATFRPEKPGFIVNQPVLNFQNNVLEFDEYTPSSIGVENCEISDDFYCTNKIEYAKSKQPRLNSRGRQIVTLNPHIGLDYTPGFQAVECDSGPGCTSCPGISYVSHDPRLLDPRRNIITKLDRPPLHGDLSVFPDNVNWNPYLDNYGKNYRTYSDINTGDIVYYYDQTISDAYSNPNFVIRSNVDHLLFKDPMGAIKPQYFREPFTNSLNYLSKDSFMRDSLFHREDLMSKQMRKHNEQRFETRWAPPNNY